MGSLTTVLTTFERLERSNATHLGECCQLKKMLKEEQAMKDRFRHVNQQQAKILAKMEKKMDHCETESKKGKEIVEYLNKEK